MPTAPPPKPDLDSIANDLAALKQDFASLIADLRANTTARAGAMAQDAAERISDKAEAGVKALSQEVEERPLTALLVAFAVGFVASRLLSR